MSGVIHIVGAGLAGLSTALHAVAKGARVRVYEGAGHAGGRCRSYYDTALNRQIDNGNHLVLTGNTSVQAYLRLAGAPDALVAAPEAAFPFIDIATSERWTVRMNDGVVPWWPLAADRRPAGVSLPAMAGAGRILFAGPDDTISALVRPDGAALTRFWEPMAFAVMNLPPAQASAQLMRATAVEAWRDGRLARPMFAPDGLGPALIAPALSALEAAGAPVQFERLVKRVERADDRVAALHFARGEPEPLGPHDRVVLAIPPHRLNMLYPEADAPEEASAILNAHFLLEDARLADRAPPILGVVGGVTQWIFPHGDVISVTVSAAEAVEGAQRPQDELIAMLWRETAAALGFADGVAPKAARLIREKRATFVQSPENVRRRPKQRTLLKNLFLAGDAVDTGLPATIEGAVRSGARAAALAA